MGEGVKINPKPGELFYVGNKLYGICIDCKEIVRLNKPFLGSLHICQPLEVRSG